MLPGLNALNTLWQGVLPYVTVPELGPIKPFGVLVVTGIVVGARIAEKRAKLLGLPAQRFASLVFWTVATGIVLSHVIDTIAYYPRTVIERPWELLMIHRGLSSFGGFIGAAIGFTVYGRKHKMDLWRAADSISYGLPFGWFFGRMGCAVVHDHPGRMSDHFLAVAYPEGSRFDLGTLELFLVPIIILAVVLVARRTTRPGSIVATIALVYPWIRFPLDFLRETQENGGDIRYFGFTPGQYAAAGCLGFGVFLYLRSKKAAEAEAAQPPVQSRRSKAHARS